MVAAVYFFATPDDEAALLDYLDEPSTSALHPWPLLDPGAPALPRADLGEHHQLTVVNCALGPPVMMGRSDPAMQEATRAGVFNRLNWERLRPQGKQGLMDANSSPVLLWQRGSAGDGVVRSSNIGSQADSMAAVSAEYERWVNRVMGWVRRRGTRVWGLERRDVRPDLDIDLSFVNTVHALPGALALLESGGSGR